MHLHIGETEKGRHHFSLSDYFSYAKEQGVNQAVAMPNLSNIVSSYVLNQRLLREYKESIPVVKSFYKLLMVFDNQITIEELGDSCTDDVVGLKFHPSISQIEASDSSLFDFYTFAQERSLPVLIHCGRNPKSHISYVLEAAKKFPKVTFIAAHLGGGATHLVDEAISIAEKENVDNLFMDTSAMKLPFLIELAIKSLGGDRIMFGSDEPYADLRIGKYCVDLTNLPSKEKENVFYNNAKRIFSLGD